MTAEQLIAEGRKLQRPSVFLRSTGSGPAAAIWHEDHPDEIESSGRRCWLTVDSQHIPGLAGEGLGLLRIYTDEVRCEGGSVETVTAWPQLDGTKLYAAQASVLPPIDAVFALGSEKVGQWLDSLGWLREWRYNPNFAGRDIVTKYERIWMTEFPLYTESDIYAVLGGWHWPCAGDDWHQLIDESLAVFTIKDSEPWVEVWGTKNRAFRVIQRTT